MFQYDHNKSLLVGPRGSLPLPSGDQASLKMAMLLQGECTLVGPRQAARNFNFSKSRYYQIRNAFSHQGVAALIGKKTGPRRNYRRTPEITKLVIRCRFLDPKASSEVIASKLRQDGHIIATRSVERIISDYGLQKKTPPEVSNTRNTPD
jgi:transposase